MPPTEIRISDVRKIVNSLLDHIEVARGITSVALVRSFYWQIAEPRRFDMSRDPDGADLVVGSLEDDWQFVSGLLAEDALPVSLQLTELAPILDFIGRTVGE